MSCSAVRLRLSPTGLFSKDNACTFCYFFRNDLIILPLVLPRSWWISGNLLVECRFTSTETVGLLGTRAQDGHLDFHTAPELWNVCVPDGDGDQW